MKITGISGQTGAGKSTLANLISEQGLGKNIEVDTIGHQMLEKPETKESLLKAFGRQILDEKGRISRKHLGRIAFSDSRQIEKLNSIMHPAMVEEVKIIIENECNNNSNYLIINAALLFSMGLDRLCDQIIYVITSPQIRLERLTRSRPWSEERAKERLFAQDNLPADRNDIIIVYNNGTEDDLAKQAQKLAKVLL